ncbi:hypothetical protein EYF80_054788 [Liparis tanakae]|uniref:Uncharacterized protein n=1 Tax=Liparis tanakae TaxID=230148 RepID=A0A4Z2F1N5_9TELE|nr:hypothetical protein EYF80_054788 [Liparis tanakae]
MCVQSCLSGVKRSSYSGRQLEVSPPLCSHNTSRFREGLIKEPQLHARKVIPRESGIGDRAAPRAPVQSPGSEPRFRATGSRVSRFSR